jgi:hypothetical protein
MKFRRNSSYSAGTRKDRVMGFQRSFLAAALVAATVVPAFGVGGERDSQAPGSTLTIAYELYIMGLPLGHVDVTARIHNGSYQAQSVMDTKGLISIFWQAHIEAQANGRIHAKGLQPALYDSRSVRRSGRQQMTVTYGPGGPTNIVMVPDRPRQAQKYPVTDEQKRNTVDPLSAMLHVATGVTATPQNPCGATAPVFDGRRRYNIEFVHLRTRQVKLDNGAYSGPALECQVKYIQIAGFKQKIIAEGKRLPPMFAWMVEMRSKADPTRRYLIPVRLWANTSWGTAEAEISRVQLDNQIVAQAR